MPAQAIGVVFGSRPRHERCLLPYSLREMPEKALIFAPASGVAGGFGALTELARIGIAIRFEFGKLCPKILVVLDRLDCGGAAFGRYARGAQKYLSA